jgi:predicted GIY-YIG superfamily endonuclease/DNA-directed RNA polymerase subunit RPC12/RpoP
LYLKKVKIYNISKEEKKLKAKYTLYDSLTGNISCHNLYRANMEEFEKVNSIMNDLGLYQLRSNPKLFSLSYKEKNDLIIEEMSKCIKKNKNMVNVNYKSIFQTQKLVMSLGSDFDIQQKFEQIKNKSFKLELHLDYKLFDQLNPISIIGSLYGLTLFSCFNNCDYICCLPKIGETFPTTFTLTNSQTLKDEEIQLNPNLNKPTLLVIFSFAIQNYFAYSELSSKFKSIIKNLKQFLDKKEIDIILIYRGEPSKFNERFEIIQDEPIFNCNIPLYIQSSANMKFPLVFQNNDIESTDSQIIVYILNNKNNLVYTGNLENIEISETFQRLCQDDTGEIDDLILYKEHHMLKYEEFKKMINIKMKELEKVIEEEIKKDNSLFYRPFISLSYNTYTNFENIKTNNERYVNHIRLRILVKQKHENLFTRNAQFKSIIAELKNYGASTIIMKLECQDIELMYHCSICSKNLTVIDVNNPVYYDDESKQVFCEECGVAFSEDIKNESFVTFINTKNYEDEIISELYESYNLRSEFINPILGNFCKICKNNISGAYYLNLTHFNIEYIESPMTPIDICEICFNEMKKGDPFLNDSYKRLNYEKFGLNYKNMIYRKIYRPIVGS